MFIYHIIKMEITRVHEVFHVRVEDTSNDHHPHPEQVYHPDTPALETISGLEDLKQNPGGGPEMIHPDTPALEISGPPPGFRRLTPY